MAIFNSIKPRDRLAHRGMRIVGLLALLCLTHETIWRATAQTENTGENTPGGRAERAYKETRERWRQQPADAQAAWQFARACFDSADAPDAGPRRAERAQEGIAAARKALAQQPTLAPAHYYLALNLGELAQTKTVGAFKLIRQMEEALKAAIELDPRFDYAGPHRTLGLLYRDAPGWPASVGSRAKARAHLEKAVALSPDYPENWLALLEGYLKWGETASARSRLAAAEATLESARQKLTGDAWVFNWQDWDRRWKQITAKLKPRNNNR